MSTREKIGNLNHLPSGYFLKIVLFLNFYFCKHNVKVSLPFPEYLLSPSFEGWGENGDWMGRVVYRGETCLGLNFL